MTIERIGYAAAFDFIIVDAASYILDRGQRVDGS